jgi:hypothetical protein
MPRIKDVFKLVRRRYAQARALVAGAIANRLPAIGFKGTHKAGGGNRTEITQAAFPDELSDARRSMPGP